MTQISDPCQSSNVPNDVSPAARMLRTVLILSGVLLGTVAIGRVIAHASPNLQKKLTADIANEDRCARGQCAAGLTPLGLPESCIVVGEPNVSSADAGN